MRLINSLMSPEVGFAIIGAGVVGLAIASELAEGGRQVFVLEKNHTFGLETSSRNSEVIHAGIYYPPNSLKARLCVAGRELIYQFCEKYRLPYRQPGKLILAVAEDEIPEIERLHQQGRENGVNDLKLLSHRELRRLEPAVRGKAALLSPSTGVLDCYSFMRFLYGKAVEKGAQFVFHTEVIDIERTSQGYKVAVKDQEGSSFFTTSVLINSAGLGSPRIAELAGIDISRSGYRLYYCKGEYFSLKRKVPIKRLIYPIPDPYGVGIHLTQSVEGRLRLGPNVRYVEEIDYTVEEGQREKFYEFARRFLPFIEREDLEPEFAGIRPKLQGPGEGFRDFVIAHEDKRGLPGFINLIGIESPGFTAAPAIARMVKKMVEELN